MPKTINITWVKNVNNMFIIGWLTSDYLSPKHHIKNFKPQNMFINSRLIQVINRLYNTGFYTRLFTTFHLLSKSFTQYPQHLLLRQLKEN